MLALRGGGGVIKNYHRLNEGTTLIRRQNLFLLLSIRKFSRVFYFRKTSHNAKFHKNNTSRNGKITVSFTDIGKSCISREF